MADHNLTIIPDVPVHNPHSYPNHSADSSHHIYPSLSSSTAVVYSDRKSFNVEANMAESLISQDPNSRPKHFRNAFEECIFVFIIIMSAASTTFLQGATVINTAIVGRALNMTAAEITWISAALGLSSGSFMLFFGKTADLLGRKLQLLLGLAFLSVFALITAFAPNGIALNVLCGFLGLGTAAISPPAIGLLFTTYPEGRRRNTVTGALGCGNPVGFLLGSISSGLATKYFNWRASFIFIAIFFFLMTILAFWTMPSFPRSANFRMVARRFDYLGTLLTIMGTGLLSAGLTEGPQEGYQSLKVVLMLTLGVFCLVGFAIWENVYTHPLLNPRIWRSRNFSLCILCVLFGYMSFITNQFWISLYMQNVQHLSSLHIAARLIPQVIAGMLWSYGGQLLVSRVSRTIIMGIGAFAYLTGATLVYFIRQTSSYWTFLFPALCITVMGADFQFIIANLYVNTQMSDQSSLGAGVLQTAMRLSISLGLAITAAVYGSSYQTTKGLIDVNYAYERAYLCSIIFAVIGILFVPFMRMRKQGDHSRIKEACSGELFEERPRTAGEYFDRNSSENKDGELHQHRQSERQLGLQLGDSTFSVSTFTTTGSQESFFPRWSWEEGSDRKDNKCRESNVVYEVCIKCLEERRVVLSECGVCGGEWYPLPGERRRQHRESSPPREHQHEEREANVMKGGAGWV